MLMLSRSRTFLRLEVFFFHDIHMQKIRKEFEQIGLQNTKNMWRENVLAQAYLWRGRTQISNIRVTRWHSKYKVLNCIERHNFCLSDLLTNSSPTTLQFNKVEERTCWTPSKMF